MTQIVLLGLKILAVENDPLNAEAMRCLLEMNGATVLGPAVDVLAALKLIDQERPDVALVDYRLNGETIETVIDTLNVHQIPFVLVTACAPILMPERFAAMTTVTKPFMIEQLLDAVIKVCTSHRPVF